MTSKLSAWKFKDDTFSIMRLPAELMKVPEIKAFNTKTVENGYQILEGTFACLSVMCPGFSDQCRYLSA